MHDLSPGITMRSTIPAYSYRHGLNFIPGIVKTRIDCYSGISNPSLIVMAPDSEGDFPLPSCAMCNTPFSSYSLPVLYSFSLSPCNSLFSTTCSVPEYSPSTLSFEEAKLPGQGRC